MCNKDAINAAADLTLYFLKHKFGDYMPIPDVEQSFLKDNMVLQARRGTFGSVHSMERVDDFELAFTNEVSNNLNKPLYRKLYTKMQGRFSNIRIQFNDTNIQFAKCNIKGKMIITVQKNKYEVLTVSSDKRNCLMDIRLVKYHEFGPIDFQIEADDGMFCAGMTTTAVNVFNKYFLFLTKWKMREVMIGLAKEYVPNSGDFLCMSPEFDVVFM